MHSEAETPDRLWVGRGNEQGYTSYDAAFAFLYDDSTDANTNADNPYWKYRIRKEDRLTKRQMRDDGANYPGAKSQKFEYD